MSKRKTTAVEEFDPARVRPLPGQPRKRFFGIRELADSILEIGQSTPGLVTLVEDDPAFDAQLIDGERRLRACTLAGVPFRAEVRSAAAMEELFVASFGANFGKQDHDAIEIAEALGRMKAAGKTHEQLARIAGKSSGWVGQHLSLLKLDPAVQELMYPTEEAPPRLTFALALMLAPLKPLRQIALAKQIVKGEGMRLKAARRMILRERTDAGDRLAYTGGGRISTGKLAGGLETAVSEFIERIGTWLDMPGAQFRTVIEALNPRDRVLLIEQIDELRELLEGLGESIGKTLPKAKSQA